MTVEGDLREKAKEMGMHLIGFSAIEKTSYAEIVRSRISQGLIPEEIVELTECFQVPDVFADPTRSLAGAKTLICVGQSYLERKSAPKDMSMRGVIGRHYWRDSYTDLVKKRDEMVKHLRSAGFKAEKAKVHPREAAKLTGLAWIGRNALAINPTYGSWALYYSIVTDAVIEPSQRIIKSCPEKCRKCMEACPTKALVEPYVLDVNRCLNHILGQRGPYPDFARIPAGNRVNGCDKCQEVCPMNSAAKPAPKHLTARELDPELVPYPKLDRCFEVTDREMADNYAHMDWFEPSTRSLRRNALIAAGNSGEKELLKIAKKYERSEDDVLKNHAKWARERLS
jgi:epoxyqueuosine reductase